MTAMSENDVIKRGDIYFVTGGGGVTVGSEQTGDRPAVVVSNDTGNRYSPVVEIVYLTTREKPDIPTHAAITSAQHPSIALCEQVNTVCKSRLTEYIGSITAEEISRIDKALSTSLGIQRKAGGDSMKLTMITPYGEMNFDMAADKVSELIQEAFQYAAGLQPGAEKSPTTLPELEEPPKPQRIEKPHRRIDSLFGDFRTENKEPEAQEEEPEEYRGFLLIKCKHCGKLKGFCAKTSISEFTCGDCGGKTALHGLKMAYLECKCGGNYKYKTNVTDETFDYNCLNCGSPVDM